MLVAGLIKRKRILQQAPEGRHVKNNHIPTLRGFAKSGEGV
jgi:hypothetical protein